MWYARAEQEAALQGRGDVASAVAGGTETTSHSAFSLAAEKTRARQSDEHSATPKWRPRYLNRQLEGTAVTADEAPRTALRPEGSSINGVSAADRRTPRSPPDERQAQRSATPTSESAVGLTHSGEMRATPHWRLVPRAHGVNEALLCLLDAAELVGAAHSPAIHDDQPADRRRHGLGESVDDSPGLEPSPRTSSTSPTRVRDTAMSASALTVLTDAHAVQSPKSRRHTRRVARRKVHMLIRAVTDLLGPAVRQPIILQLHPHSAGGTYMVRRAVPVEQHPTASALAEARSSVRGPRAPPSDTSATATLAVFKPREEEIGLAENPHGHWASDRDAVFRPGTGSRREMLAYCLDHEHLAGVPPTLEVVAEAAEPESEPTHPSGQLNGRQTSADGSSRLRVGSLQSFVPDCVESADVLPGEFDVEEVQAIAVFDIRVLNGDRHGGNILVTPHNPSARWYPEPRRPGHKCRHRRRDRPSDPHSTTIRADIVPHNETISDVPTNSSLSATSTPPSSSLVSASASSASDDTSDDDDDAAGSWSTRRGEGTRRVSRRHLVPIDHSYVCPSGYADPDFEWLAWPQSKQPFTPRLLAYIARLDPETDAALVRAALLPRATVRQLASASHSALSASPNSALTTRSGSSWQPPPPPSLTVATQLPLHVDDGVSGAGASVPPLARFTDPSRTRLTESGGRVLTCGSPASLRGHPASAGAASPLTPPRNVPGTVGVTVAGVDRSSSSSSSPLAKAAADSARGVAAEVAEPITPAHDSPSPTSTTTHGLPALRSAFNARWKERQQPLRAASLSADTAPSSLDVSRVISPPTPNESTSASSSAVRPHGLLRARSVERAPPAVVSRRDVEAEHCVWNGEAAAQRAPFSHRLPGDDETTASGELTSSSVSSLSLPDGVTGAHAELYRSYSTWHPSAWQAHQSLSLARPRSHRGTPTKDDRAWRRRDAPASSAGAAAPLSGILCPSARDGQPGDRPSHRGMRRTRSAVTQPFSTSSPLADDAGNSAWHEIQRSGPQGHTFVDKEAQPADVDAHVRLVPPHDLTPPLFSVPARLPSLYASPLGSRREVSFAEFVTTTSPTLLKPAAGVTFGSEEAPESLCTSLPSTAVNANGLASVTEMASLYSTDFITDTEAAEAAADTVLCTTTLLKIAALEFEMSAREIGELCRRPRITAAAFLEEAMEAARDEISWRLDIDRFQLLVRDRLAEASEPLSA